LSYETFSHVTVLSNFIRGYDRYARVYSKSGIPESTFPHRFFLLRDQEIDIGIAKGRRLLDKLALPGNRLLVLHTRVPSEALRPNTSTHLGQFVDSPSIPIDSVALIEDDAPGGSLLPLTVEEASARSLQLLRPELCDYQQLKPRTFSVLPIARGCQASCPFCFSEASVSAEEEQAHLDLSHIRHFAATARERGAERFVITGGGEPGLVRHERLRQIIATGHEALGKTVLITNGHHLARQDHTTLTATLDDYGTAGLNVLAISRHHHDDEISERLMRLRTNVAGIASAWYAGRTHWPDLKLRFICVLQRGAIDSATALESYVAWAASLGVQEICFKELYVSTSVESVYHHHATNAWSHANQVPLALVLDFATRHGYTEVTRLPWGAPVFSGQWRGRPLQIAAYTEPSLFWERTHGMARSWNLMPNGRCLASLEDRSSEIVLPTTLAA
jgi:pyruvate-formate lyase-activating enzyme